MPEVTPYYGIPAIPAYPFDGSAVVIWDSGNPPPPIGNVAPPEILPTRPRVGDALGLRAGPRLGPPRVPAAAARGAGAEVASS